MTEHHPKRDGNTSHGGVMSRNIETSPALAIIFGIIFGSIGLIYSIISTMVLYPIISIVVWVRKRIEFR